MSCKIIFSLVTIFSIVLICKSLELPKIMKVCKRCFKNYDISENSRKSCNFHRGKFIGAESAKHMGTKSGGSNKGLALFWDCCDLETFEGKGCMLGKHISYDELDDDPYFSVLMNKPIA